MKGVTLEEGNIVMFLDAKTERGVKYVNELIKVSKEGYKCYVIFVVQIEDVLYFTPNKKIHLELADILKSASENGVDILAYDCKIEPNRINIKQKVKVIL